VQLTLLQAATYLGVNEPTVRRWMRERSLPVHRINERFYLNAIELWEWATKQHILVSRRLLDEARRSDEIVPPLSSLLATGGIHYKVPGRNKAEVLHEVVARLPLPPEIDRDFLIAVLEARERLGSTGVGQGVAIPHVRHPILLHVPAPFVTLCLLAQPIDFDAHDRMPVHTLFMVVSPNVPSHLRILAQLAFALRDDTMRQLLRDRAPANEILNRFGMVEQRATSAFQAITEE
jgi:PTS system nitrogen regulatory IIA component